MSATLTVRELIAGELKAAGVSVVSGLVAEDTAFMVTDLMASGIRYQPAKHENVAVNIADGYAWASGGLGVVTVGRGPGLANAGLALGNLVHGQRPVVVITTYDPKSVDPHSGAFKAMNQERFVESFGLEYVRPETPEEVSPGFRRAVGFARAGKPCVLAVPITVMAGEAPVPDAPEPAAEAVPVQPSAEDVKRLVDLFEESERPIIIAGVGAIHAKDALVELAERAGALLATSLRAKDLFRGQPYDLRIMGGYSTETTRELAGEADFVFGFGASLNVWTRGHGLRFPHARVVAIDNDPAHLGRMAEIDVGLVGDARLMAQAALDRLEPRGGTYFHQPEVLERIENHVVWPRNDESTEDTIDPRLLTDLLEELLPPDRQVLTDSGHFSAFPMVGLRSQPLSIREGDEFVAVGMGLGIAMGVALARPERTTVACLGDGGMAMTLGDIEPLVHFEQPLIVVVYNDQAYGAERHVMDMKGKANGVSLLPDVDFARIAVAMGLDGATIRSEQDLRKVPLAGRDKTIVLDCKVNPLVKTSLMIEGPRILELMMANAAA